MREDVLRVLLIDDAEPPSAALDMLALGASGYGPFAIEACAGLAAAGGALGAKGFDAVLLHQPDATRALHLPHWPGLSQASADAAVVVWLAAPGDALLARRLLEAGVQDVIAPAAETSSAEVARSLRFAVERKRIECAQRKAYATDLQTGLPNRQQLIEHASQLLALRGREPAPMALLVIRVEGFASAEAALGRESANVLRRKVAVRLRAAVRASDVVAALGHDVYAVLLASTESAQDADRVAAKLLKALQPLYTVAGRDLAVSAAVGVSCYPADGSDSAMLLRQASAAAAAAQASGRDGFANWQESGWQGGGAANDA